VKRVYQSALNSGSEPRGAKHLGAAGASVRVTVGLRHVWYALDSFLSLGVRMRQNVAPQEQISTHGEQTMPALKLAVKELHETSVSELPYSICRPRRPA
jgi:hypothetical protein